MSPVDPRRRQPRAAGGAHVVILALGHVEDALSVHPRSLEMRNEVLKGARVGFRRPPVLFGDYFREGGAERCGHCASRDAIPVRYYDEEAKEFF